MGKVLRLQLQNLLGILDVEWNEESNTIQMAMAALHVLFLCSMVAIDKLCTVMRARDYNHALSLFVSTSLWHCLTFGQQLACTCTLPTYL